VRHVPVAAVCAATLVLTGAQRDGQNLPSLDDLLHAAGEYLAQYERDISVVVSEEDYLQVARGTTGSPSSRHLRSDFLVLNVLDDWISYRDVFEVDGRPVRDRKERLAALFMKPNTDALAQAAQIAAESSRFNLSQSVVVGRTINVPMTALKFLRTDNQRRSTFRVAGRDNLGGLECTVIRFSEQDLPRLLFTDNESGATGTFWIEAASGRVRRSELVLETARTVPRGRSFGAREETVAVRATIRVDYAEQPRLRLSLPVSMSEHYEVTPRNVSIDGRATYSNFRQFQVDTGTSIKVP
jgi:hypothetical protein